MPKTNAVTTRIPRRQFLATAGAGAMALAFPWKGSFAQPQTMYRRMNLSDPNFDPRILNRYAGAVYLLLTTDPRNPNNWYRMAFTHLFDCPHGNWWFLPWHRGLPGLV